MTNLRQPNEVWKDISGYEGLYQISSKGSIRSVDHYSFRKVVGKEVLIKGRTLKVGKTQDGYKQIRITGNQKPKTIRIHRTMWQVFNGDIPKGLEVDHIDNNKQNNLLSNFQLLPCRKNSTKRSMNLAKTSAYTGVSWCKNRLKWQSHIRINGKSKSLGRFKNEIEAATAYLTALKQIS